MATREKLMFLFLMMIFVYRSSHLKVLCKVDVLNSFPNISGKNLCRSLFSKKIADWRSATFLKRELDTKVLL